MKRVFWVVMDMLAGHWAEGVVVPQTGLCPPNVDGYINANMLPTFREIREEGIFANCWNMSECNTPNGNTYLAYGSYQPQKSQDDSILSACKKRYPQDRVLALASDVWTQTGWWKAPDCTLGFGSYFSDFVTMQYAFKWLLENSNWRMALLYLPQYDLTGNCPVYKENAKYGEDKHHSIQILDKLLWNVVTFLKEMTWWEETYLFITSDHGCHVGCDIAVKEGLERGVAPHDLSNYCSNHQAPHDCYLWDFAEGRATARRVDCSRRTLFMVGGGALAEDLRGTRIDRAEIIDCAPTAAKVLDIPFSRSGRSIIT